MIPPAVKRFGGSGPALLLLPGIANRSTVFCLPPENPLAELLARTHTVLLGDFRSGAPTAACPDWDFDSYVWEDLPIIWQQALALTGGNPPTILGYSLGGMAALVGQAMNLLAAPRLIALGSPFLFRNLPMYPELMRATLRGAEWLGWRRIPICWLGRLLVLFLDLHAGSSAERLRLRRFRRLIDGVAMDLPRAMLSQACSWMARGQVVDRAGAVDYRDVLRNISVPVLFLAGEKDRIAPAEAVEAGRVAIDPLALRQTALHVIPGADHITLGCGPERFKTAAAVLQWLAQ
jgi:pimeloyl-ACP methyl ester carboxylesterase